MTLRFYAVPNDLIGGWDVSEHDKPTSQHDFEAGEATIGSFMSEDWAVVVANTLNGEHNETECPLCLGAGLLPHDVTTCADFDADWLEDGGVSHCVLRHPRSEWGQG